MTYDFSYVLSENLPWKIYTSFHAMPFLLSVVSYVLTAIGLYTMAQRRGLKNPWLAWIPVANIWLIGSLSDQYRYVVKGQVRSRRKLLLTLKIISSVLTCILLFSVFGSVFDLVAGAVYGIHEDQLLKDLLGALLQLGGIALLMLPLSIVLAVFRYMAIYDIYQSCEPDNAVMFLVFSILFHVTEPFFLFFSREKEKGMPPRRQPPRPEPRQSWQEAPQNEAQASAPQPETRRQETEVPTEEPAAPSQPAELPAPEKPEQEI